MDAHTIADRSMHPADYSAMRDRISRLLIAASLLCGSVAAFAQSAPTACGTLENAFGPYDYRVDRGQPLRLVDSAHFTPAVEALVRGNTGQSPYAVVGCALPPMSQRPLAIRHLVSPNRFGLLGIPITAGRDFDEHDTPQSTPVIIINEAMARQLFPGQNPLGQKLVTGMMGLSAEIVGVTADVHTTSLVTAPAPEMFYPVFQRPENFTAILVRTDGDPAALAQSVRAALHDVDAGLPLTNPGTMRDFVERSMADRQLTMALLVVFAALALVLASLGVYSVMAYSVAQRSGEIGIRMALGARAAHVQKMIVRQGMTLAAVGVAIGVAAALTLTRMMSALLFEVKASDPRIYTAIAALLGIVAVAACWIPSRRAARVDPMKALHDA